MFFVLYIKAEFKVSYFNLNTCNTFTDSKHQLGISNQRRKNID